MNYPHFFKKASRFAPYPYQAELGRGETLPTLLTVPTGAGKTEAAVLGWLYRRLEHPDQAVRDSTPRRLVYCLPMRTLVEQTVTRIENWLISLDMASQVGVVTLMGGEPGRQWYLEPEKPFVIVGTQDMLLSRALNHGYGSGYNMWPIEYGLVNNDCLWVMDEVQLMANGLPTSTQLAGLRCKLRTFGPTHSMWMSATVRPDWLATIDHSAPSPADVLSLGYDDLACPGLRERHVARKVVTEAHVDIKKRAINMADLVASQHKPGTLTLAIVNTVELAQDVYRALTGSRPKVPLDAEKLLVHSRFREEDRKRKNDLITAEPNPSGPGLVVVSTQAVEAGVDISARTLITEVAPWPSLIQRFGRCNRTGKEEQGDIIWVDVQEKKAAPYEPKDLAHARKLMRSLEGRSAGPSALEELGEEIGSADHLTVIRRRDVVGLFDTTPDLSGSYLDVSQYVRGDNERDVSIFWRDVVGEEPGGNESRPRHSETVAVPMGSKGIGGYLRKDERRRAWRWDFLDDKWMRIQERDIHPGMTLMLEAERGGYSPDTGWSLSSKERVEPVPVLEGGREPDGQGSDPTNTLQRKWVSLSEHSRHVEKQARGILDAFSQWITDPGIREALTLAALYHDVGKAHPAFQDMLRNGGDCPPEKEIVLLAKSRGNGKMDSERRHFRHELGSALAVLEHADVSDDDVRDLAAYLAAAHHGKVRIGIRSLPGRRVGYRESNPDPDRLLGYSISEPEQLPPVDLGNGLNLPGTTLDLSIAWIGLNGNGQRSWLDRSLALLDRLGPFRLAYLEAIVRAADMRASKQEQEAGH